MRKPSPAMVVACLALGVAMTGTSIAATQIGKNEVGAKEFGKVTQRTETDLGAVAATWTTRRQQTSRWSSLRSV